MKSLVVNTLFFITILSSIASVPLSADVNGILSEHKVFLTEDEVAWLKVHPDIKLGYTDAFEPEVIVNPDGTYRGIQVDILRELNRRLGTSIGLQIFPVPEVIEKAIKKEVDGILSLHPGYADELGLLKTGTYFSGYPAVFARKDLPYDSPSDFIDRKVAIIDQVFFSEQIIKQHGKGATILKVKDAEEGLHFVDSGKADFFLGATLNAYLLTKYQLFSLATQHVFYDHRINAVIGTRPDWPELSSILDKGLESITKEEIESIAAKWTHLPEEGPVHIRLTPEEKTWLGKNHTVRVRGTEHAPLMYYEDGKPVGISSDFLNEVSKRTGIKFEISKPSRDFPTAMKGLIEHEGPDLIAGSDPIPEREEVVMFTKTYWSSPKFIFTRDDAPFVSSMADLSGRTVAVIDGYVTHKLLEKDSPDVVLQIYETNKKALTAVSSGKAFAFIGSLATTSSVMNELGLVNLRACAPSSLPDATVAMGIRSDWPELRDIFNKVLDSMTAAEKAAINNRWSSIRFEHGIKPVDVVKWSMAISGAVILMVLLFIIWNRQLGRKVRERTAELMEMRNYTDHLIQTANVMIVSLDPEGRVNHFNPAAEKITGYGLDEIRGENWFETLVPCERYPYVHEEFERLMQGGIPHLFENPIQTKQGGERFISWSNSEIKKGPRNVGVISFGIDVTERRKAEESLKVSEKKFRELMEQAPYAISIVNPDGRIDQVNQAFMKLWGFTEEAWPGIKDNYNFLEDPEAIRLGAMPLIEKAFNGEIVELPLVEYIAKNATYTIGIETTANRRWVQVRLYPLKNNQGDVVKVVDVAEDITSRKQAEDALKESEQKLSGILDSISDHISMMDKDLTVVWSNDVARKIFGPDVNGKKCYACYHGTKHPCEPCLVQKTFKDGQIHTHETTVVDKEGASRVFHCISSVAELDENGKPKLVIEVSRDITIEKEKENKIRDSEEKLRHLVEQSPYSIQIFNSDGTLEQVNEAFKKLWGVTEETLSELFEKYNVLEDEEAGRMGVSQAIQQAFDGESVRLPLVEYDAGSTFTEIGMSISGGNKRWILPRFYPLKNNHGEVVKVVSMEVDVTERIQAEGNYRALVEQAQDGIAVVSDGKLKFVNSSLAEMTGHSVSEILGTPFIEFVSDDEKSKVTDAYIKRLKNETTPSVYETVINHKDGSKIEVEFNAGSTIYDGQPAVQVIVRDIGKRKEQERALHEYQQRLKALASQLTVAEERERHSIAEDLHDLIGHSLALARMQLDTALSTSSRIERTLMVKDVSNILLKSIQDTKNLIFELSSPLMHEIGLGAAISEWLEDVMARRYGLETEFIDEIDDRFRKSMDENVRAILFRNVRELLTNVIKHARAKKVGVFLNNEDTMVTITVEDDGVGCDRGTVDTKQNQADGFGLFSIQERMADLGGSLEIISEPGKGCKAIISVPLDKGLE